MIDGDRRFLEALLRSSRSDAPSPGARYRALARVRGELEARRLRGPEWIGRLAFAFVALVALRAFAPGAASTNVRDGAASVMTARASTGAPCAAGVEAPAGACGDIEQSGERSLAHAAGSSSGASLGSS